MRTFSKCCAAVLIAGLVPGLVGCGGGVEPFVGLYEMSGVQTTGDQSRALSGVFLEMATDSAAPDRFRLRVLGANECVFFAELDPRERNEAVLVPKLCPAPAQGGPVTEIVSGRVRIDRGEKTLVMNARSLGSGTTSSTDVRVNLLPQVNDANKPLRPCEGQACGVLRTKVEMKVDTSTFTVGDVFVDDVQGGLFLQVGIFDSPGGAIQRIDAELAVGACAGAASAQLGDAFRPLKLFLKDRTLQHLREKQMWLRMTAHGTNGSTLLCTKLF